MRDALLERAPAARRVILLTLVVGVPVFFFRLTNDPFGLPKLLLLFIGVSLAGGLRLLELIHKTTDAVGLKRALLPAVALMGGLSTAWLFSSYRGWAVLGSYGRLQGLLPYFAVVLLGILLADAFAGRPEELARGLLWSGAIVGAYAVIQTVGLDPFEWNLFGAPTSGISTIGNPNFTGGFLGIVMPIGLGLLFVDPVRRSIYLRLMVAVAAGWLVARSQGGWAAGVAGSVVVLGARSAPRWRWARPAAFITAGGIAAATTGVVLANLVAPDSRFALEAFAARAGWWHAAIGMFMDSPFVGRGPDVFGIEGVAFRPLADALRFRFDFANDPHSVPLAMLANAGVLGLAGWGFALGYALWKGLKGAPSNLLAAGFAAAVIAYAVQASVSIDELSLRVALWTAIAGVIATTVPRVTSSHTPRAKSGGTVSTRKRRRTTKVNRSRGPTALSIVIGAVVVGLLGLTLVWGVADARVKEARDLFGQGLPEETRRVFESAIALHDVAEYRGLLALRLRDAALAREGFDANLFAGSDAAFDSLLNEIPIVFSFVAHGRLLEAWAERDPGPDEGPLGEALAQYRAAAAIDPLNPRIRNELGRLLIDLRRLEEAFAALEPLAEKVPSDEFVDLWGRLALAAAKAGDTDLAAQAIDRALAANPAQEDALKAQARLDESSR